MMRNSTDNLTELEKVCLFQVVFDLKSTNERMFPSLFKRSVIVLIPLLNHSWKKKGFAPTYISLLL